jgi:hypothetical protein
LAAPPNVGAGITARTRTTGAAVYERVLLTKDIELLRIRWWDWPTERVLAEVDRLNGRPMDAFIEGFDVG